MKEMTCKGMKMPKKTAMKSEKDLKAKRHEMMKKKDKKKGKDD